MWCYLQRQLPIQQWEPSSPLVAKDTCPATRPKPCPLFIFLAFCGAHSALANSVTTFPEISDVRILGESCAQKLNIDSQVGGRINVRFAEDAIAEPIPGASTSLRCHITFAVEVPPGFQMKWVAGRWIGQATLPSDSSASLSLRANLADAHPDGHRASVFAGKLLKKEDGQDWALSFPESEVWSACGKSTTISLSLHAVLRRSPSQPQVVNTEQFDLKLGVFTIPPLIYKRCDSSQRSE